MASGHQKDPKIVKMVRDQLTRRKSPPNVKALYGRAVRINPEIRKLSLRQFNAIYPLQVRRQLKREERRASRPAVQATESKPGAARGNGGSRRAKDGAARAVADRRRSAVRSELFAFAGTVAQASGRGELIDVVLDLDRWIDRVESAVRGSGG